MIKVFISGKSYTIEVNGKIIVQCNDPIIPFKDLLLHLGFDLSKNKVEIYDGGNVTSIEAENTNVDVDVDSVIESTDLDSVISSMNDTFVSPNLGKYRETFENKEITYIGQKIIQEKTSTKTESKHEPVGSVDCPNEGDLIYVDGITGILSKVIGGVGTVMTVYKSGVEIDVDTDDREDWDSDEDEDEEYFETTEENILIELEEIPGHYFSWSLLRNQQATLKNKYGYKPACKI